MRETMKKNGIGCGREILKLNLRFQIWVSGNIIHFSSFPVIILAEPSMFSWQILTREYWPHSKKNFPA